MRRHNIDKNHETVTQSAVSLYLRSIGPEHLAVQQRVEGVSQTLLPLRTVATDDVTGGADAPEEIHADGGGGDSRGDVSQVHVDGDFLFRGGFRSCDESETFQNPQAESHLRFIPIPGSCEELAGAARVLDEGARVEDAFPLVAPLWLPGLFFPELIIWGDC